MTVSDPITRPIQHWDALLQEETNMGFPHTWVLHLGESFPDVPTGNLFYTFVETLFHKGVTTGCAGGVNYCPTNAVTRAQMAVFLLKSKFGQHHVPPPCTGTVFNDVPCTGGGFDPWIEELASLNITGGCGNGNYCPNNTVTRQQMAVFLLKALEGSSYDPPDCAGLFVGRRLHAGSRLLRLDRGDLRPPDHGRLLGGAPEILPDQSQQPRTDGGVPGEDVRTGSVRRIATTGMVALVANN